MTASEVEELKDAVADIKRLLIATDDRASRRRLKLVSFDSDLDDNEIEEMAYDIQENRDRIEALENTVDGLRDDLQALNDSEASTEENTDDDEEIS